MLHFNYEEELNFIGIADIQKYHLHDTHGTQGKDLSGMVEHNRLAKMEKHYEGWHGILAGNAPHAKLLAEKGKNKKWLVRDASGGKQPRISDILNRCRIFHPSRHFVPPN